MAASAMATKNGQGSCVAAPKRQPPPIPKRNPNTRLSGIIPPNPRPRPPTLSRSLDYETAALSGKKSELISSSNSNLTNSNNQRPYSTLPRRRTQRLDICAELLNYISELTQELMAETSFTEFTSGTTDEPLSPRPAEVSLLHTSSVAIQTDTCEISTNRDATRNKTVPSQSSLEGRSIGTQVPKQWNGIENPPPTVTQQSSLTVIKQVIPMLPSKSLEIPSTHSSSSPSTKPFREIRKMLREGSIEGIEDEPPVFKPPPPPQSTPPPLKPPVVTPKKKPVILLNECRTGPKVRKCLSTFEPPSKVADVTRVSPKKPGRLPPNKSAPNVRQAQDTLCSGSARIVQAQSMAYIKPFGQQCRQASEDLTAAAVVPSAQVDRKRCRSAGDRSTLNVYPKAASTDRSWLRSAGNVGGDKGKDDCVARIPPPPPPPDIDKEPPPKIVVERPVKKHRPQNSSCGTTCSCLCLKRQSPCGSPVPSLTSLPAVTSPSRRRGPYSSGSKCSSEKNIYNNTDIPCARQEAYDALIAEIRAAIKRRQSSVDGDKE